MTVERTPPELPSGVVTFLLTDIEGSSGLWEERPRAMAAALARHDELIADRVASHGGVTLKAKGEGDATLSVFRRPSDAVEAALDLAEALYAEAWPEAITLRVRLAVHTGEAYERDGDYFGPTLNRAARVRSVASGGQIVLSEVTAQLVRDRLPADVGLADLGRHALRGLSRDERLYSLVRHDSSRAEVLSDAAAAEDLVLSFPSALVAETRREFAGREPEVEWLLAAWDEVRNGRRKAVFLAGEPGIGKTHLAAECARRAHSQGALVVYGRCDEEMLVPYQPFVEALEPYVAACPPVTLRAQLQGLGGELARVLPRLAQRVPNLMPPVQGEPDTERYRLFEAVSALVAGMTEAQPVVMVLDDLQWADQPTLLLLRHVLRIAEERPLLLLGAYRDVELTRTDPLAKALVDFRREEVFERMPLGGLSEREIEELLTALAGHDVAETFVAALHQATAGNPFFVREMVRHLAETGALEQRDGRWATGLAVEDLGLPEGIRDLVGRRLARLSPEANSALTLAAVVGREFELPVLQQAVDLDADVLLDALDEAVRARLIDDVSGASSRHEFAHVLIREALYRELTSVRRALLHARVAAAIEELYATEPGHLGELAHHYFEAAHAGDASKAVTYCRAAGDQAMVALAYEEAAEQYEHSLQALELDPVPDESRRGELLLAIGDASWRAGDRERSREAYSRAIDLAKTVDDPHLFGTAVLGLGTGQSSQEGFDASTQPSQETIAELEQALAALPDDDSSLRARLLGRLAVAVYWSASDERRVELSDEAVAMARRIGDRLALLRVLVSRMFALWGREALDERLADATEVLELAEELGRPDDALEARFHRVICFMTIGDIAAVDEEIATYRRVADELRQPHYRWYGMALAAMRAIVDGRFAEGERLAHEALAIGEAIQEPAAAPIFGGQLLAAWRAQGRFVEFDELMVAIRDLTPTLPATTAPRAWAAAQLGRSDEARSLFDALAATSFELPRDVAWNPAMALLCETCAILRDASAAAALDELIRPYSGQYCVSGPHAWGPVDYSRGLLARTRGDIDAALAHFEAALQLATAMGARPDTARIQHESAVTLLQRDAPGDRDKAATLLREALATANELGMATLMIDVEARLNAL